MIRRGLTSSIKRLSKAFKSAGYPLYLVGGWPRNMLLGLPISDIDAATPAPPELAYDIAVSAGWDAARINPRLGTLKVSKGDAEIELTSFRHESYSSNGAHSPTTASFGVSMQEDAARRDFTVNALYYEPLSGELYDPTGRGKADIEARRLCCVRAGETMQDDGLRLMRLARLAAELGFTIERSTFIAAKQNAALIDDVSCERIRDELMRLITADTKYGCKRGVINGLIFLNALGLFTRIFPEYVGAEKIGKCIYHKHNVLYHSLYACAFAPPEPRLRLAALLHDIGKPAVFSKNGNMHTHEVAGEELCRAALKRLKFDNVMTAGVSLLVRCHMYDMDGRTRENKLRKRIQELGIPVFYELAAIREADAYASGDYRGPVAASIRWRTLAAKMKREGGPFSLAELKISGEELIRLAGYTPGKTVGAALKRLLSHTALYPGDNNLPRLLSLARAIKKDVEGKA